MKEIKLFLFFCLIPLSAAGQLVNILEKDTGFVFYEPVSEFHAIDKNLDLSNKKMIATLKGVASSSGKSNIINLFNEFWDTANKLGANSFKVDNFMKYPNGQLEATLSLYSLTNKDLDENQYYLPKNMVYVFGNLEKGNQPTRTIVFNKQKIKLSPWEYVSYLNPETGEATISIGGVLGTKVWIYGKKDKLPKYLSLSGFKVGPTLYGNSIGIKISTGKIYQINNNVGQFLAEVLDEKQKINYTKLPVPSSPYIRHNYEKEEQAEINKYGKLILFRRNKKQSTQTFDYVINDSITGSLIPNSYTEIPVLITNKPVRIRFGSSNTTDIEVSLTAYSKTKYIECFLSKKGNLAKLEELDERNGKFYSDQAKHFQDKRDKK